MYSFNSILLYFSIQTIISCQRKREGCTFYAPENHCHSIEAMKAEAQEYICTQFWPFFSSSWRTLLSINITISAVSSVRVKLPHFVRTFIFWINPPFSEPFFGQYFIPPLQQTHKGLYHCSIIKRRPKLLISKSFIMQVSYKNFNVNFWSHDLKPIFLNLCTFLVISNWKKPKFFSRYTFTLEIPVLTGPQSIGLS